MKVMICVRFSCFSMCVRVYICVGVWLTVCVRLRLYKFMCVYVWDFKITRECCFTSSDVYMDMHLITTDGHIYDHIGGRFTIDVCVILFGYFRIFNLRCWFR